MDADSTNKISTLDDMDFQRGLPSIKYDCGNVKDIFSQKQQPYSVTVNWKSSEVNESNSEEGLEKNKVQKFKETLIGGHKNQSACRTCWTPSDALSMHALKDYQHDEQATLEEMLYKITNIENFSTIAVNMPQKICTSCAFTLKSAFVFRKQALDVNSLRSEQQQPSNIEELKGVKHGDCLLETPIDIPQTLKDSINEEEISEIKEFLLTASDPITIVNSTDSWQSEGCDQEENTHKERTDGVVFAQREQVKLTDKITNVIGVCSNGIRHKCGICDKTFAWKKDLQRHLKIHFAKPCFKCQQCDRLFIRKDKLNDHIKTHKKSINLTCSKLLPLSGWSFSHRLYSPKRCTKIECKLCENSFNNTGLLRQHLREHMDPETFKLQVNCDLYKEHFNEVADVDILKQFIIEELSQSNLLIKYYMVINEFGYEMCLSDSDTEDESGNKKYQCELCQSSYGRKHQLQAHVFQEHANTVLPYNCNNCKVGFVCETMYKMHEQTQCECALKKYSCAKCPGKFVWFDNLVMHSCEETGVCQSNESITIKNELTNANGVIHQPDDVKLTSPHSKRSFNRKDKTDPYDGRLISTRNKVCTVDPQLCKPHGSKTIRCQVCLSHHTRIADLRVHLLNHQHFVTFDNRSDNANIDQISALLYPEEPRLCADDLRIRIMADIKAGSDGMQNLERFYSITNESGYELSLNSSETESDGDDNITTNNRNDKNRNYTCDLCALTFERKYEILSHQLQHHEWSDAKNVCIQCGARFICLSLLQHHMRNQCQSSQKRFHCTKCPIRFKWKENLDSHLRISHSGTIKAADTVDTSLVTCQKFSCSECPRSFKMKKDLTRHVIMHRSEIVYNCLWCQRKFYRMKNIHAHIRRHGVAPHELAAATFHVKAFSSTNGPKRIECKRCDCNINFNSIFELRRHFSSVHQDIEQPMPPDYDIITASGTELELNDSETDGEEKLLQQQFRYTCSLCPLKCKRKYELLQHQRTMHRHEQLPYKCEHCYFRCVSKDILAYHIRTQCENVAKQFRCKECGHKFMLCKNLELHMRHFHQSSELVTNQQASAGNGDVSESVEKIFYCERCPKKYNRKDRLNAHIRTAHQLKEHGEINAAVLQSSGSATKKFLCSFCGRAVTSSSNLIVHMRRHTGEKPFQCDFCEMAFPRSSDLQCHRRTHTGERPHKCSVCGKCFSRSYKLQTHMRIHSGEKPYKCTYCDKKFTQSYDLTLHIRRHTGEKPFVCDVCGERFIQSTALRNHRTLRGHHEMLT